MTVMIDELNNCYSQGALLLCIPNCTLARPHNNGNCCGVLVE